MHLFITGTDTGVGKTYFTSWLIRAWRKAGKEAAALKPLATGDRLDGQQLHEACGQVLTLDEINPVYFNEAAAPLVAAETENRKIDTAELNDSIRAMAKRFTHLAVEGVGGWRVPIAPNYDVRDWAWDLDFPVVVVARGNLGTLNHTQLTVESINASGLKCIGVVLNYGPDEGASPDLDLACARNAALLRDLLALPVFELHRSAHAAGHLPAWLGGEEV